MQNPFRNQARSSTQEASKQDPALGQLASHLILAEKHQKSGNSAEHINALVNFNFALKQQKLDDEKARLKQEQKADLDLRKVLNENQSLTTANKLIENYLERVKAGDTKGAVAILAAMKDSQPQIAAMLEARGNPLHEAAQHGVEGDVQHDIYVDQNKEALNKQSTDEVITRKQVTGKELTPYEKAIQAQIGGEDIDAGAAARVDAGLQADANTMQQTIPEEQLLSQYFMQNFGAFGFSEEEAEQVNRAILLGEVTKDELAAEIDTLVKPDGMADAQWIEWKNQKKAEILGAEGLPSAARTTDTAAYEAMVDKYNPNDPMITAFGAIAKIYPASQANRVAKALDRIAGGKNWVDQTPEKQEQIALDMKQTVDIEGPGGESVRKVMQARELLQRDVPYLVGLLDAYAKKHGVDALGRDLQIVDGAVKFVTGAVRTPELDAIFTSTQDIIANVLLIRSGATVTDAERQVMNAMMPVATVPLPHALARAGELLKAGQRAAEAYYGKILGPTMTAPIIAKYYTPEVDKLRDTQEVYSPTPLPAGVTEEQVTEMMRRTEKSRKEVIDFLNQQGTK